MSSSTRSVAAPLLGQVWISATWETPAQALAKSISTRVKARRRSCAQSSLRGRVGSSGPPPPTRAGRSRRSGGGTAHTHGGGRAPAHPRRTPGETTSQRSPGSKRRRGPGSSPPRPPGTRRVSLAAARLVGLPRLREVALRALGVVTCVEDLTETAAGLCLLRGARLLEERLGRRVLAPSVQQAAERGAGGRIAAARQQRLGPSRVGRREHAALSAAADRILQQNRGPPDPPPVRYGTAERRLWTTCVLQIKRPSRVRWPQRTRDSP